MNGIEEYQNHLGQQSLATVASAEELAKHFQVIAAAHADNAKRSFREGAAFFWGKKTGRREGRRGRGKGGGGEGSGEGENGGEKGGRGEKRRREQQSKRDSRGRPKRGCNEREARGQACKEGE